MIHITILGKAIAIDIDDSEGKAIAANVEGAHKAKFDDTQLPDDEHLRAHYLDIRKKIEDIQGPVFIPVHHSLLAKLIDSSVDKEFEK